LLFWIAIQIQMVLIFQTEEKSPKTIQELDREKLENKFSKDGKETLN
jgi:hypothetical protein